MPQINAAGLSLVKKSEGLFLRAYRDSVGVWTIGWGHTGKDVHPGMTITTAQAESYLRGDMQGACNAVQHLVADGMGVQLTPNQFSALASLVFNVGPDCLVHTRLAAALADKDFPAAAADFLAWDHAGGSVLAGLDTRRHAERALFLTP